MHHMIVEVRCDCYDSGMGALKLTEDARAMFNNGNAFSWNSLEATKERQGGYVASEMWAAMVS